MANVFNILILAKKFEKVEYLCRKCDYFFGPEIVNLGNIVLGKLMTIGYNKAFIDYIMSLGRKKGPSRIVVGYSGEFNEKER